MQLQAQEDCFQQRLQSGFPDVYLSLLSIDPVKVRAKAREFAAMRGLNPIMGNMQTQCKFIYESLVLQQFYAQRNATLSQYYADVQAWRDRPAENVSSQRIPLVYEDKGSSESRKSRKYKLLGGKRH